MPSRYCLSKRSQPSRENRPTIEPSKSKGIPYIYSSTVKQENIDEKVSGDPSLRRPRFQHSSFSSPSHEAISNQARVG